MFTAECKRVFHSKGMRILGVVLLCTICLLSGKIIYNSDHSGYSKAVEQTTQWNYTDPENVEIQSQSITDVSLRNMLIYPSQAYHEILSEKENIESKQDSILFADRKEQEFFSGQIGVAEKLLSHTPSPVNSDVVIQLFQASCIPMSMVLLIGVFILHVLVEEDLLSHTMRLYNATKTSSVCRIFAKTSVIVTVVIALSFLVYLSGNAVLKICGIDGSMPIQYIPGYMQLDKYYTVSSYWSVLILMRTGAVLFLIALFGSFLILFQNAGMAMFLCLVFMIIEYLCASFISGMSSFAIFVDLNIWTMMTTSSLPTGLSTVLGHVITKNLIFSILIYIGTFILFGWMIYLYDTNIVLHHESSIKKTWKHRSLGAFDNRELLFKDKGLLILCIIALFCSINAIRYRSVITTDEQILRDTRSVYFGPLTEESIADVQNDLQEAVKASDAFQTQLIELSQGREFSEIEFSQMDALQQKANTVPALIKVLEEMQESKNAGAEYYFVEPGLDLVMNKNGSVGGLAEQLLVLIPPLLLGVLMISDIYGNGMHRMLFSSITGERKTIDGKLNRVMVYGFLLYMVVYGIRILKIMKFNKVSLTGISASDALGVSLNVPVWVYMLLQMMLRLMYLYFLLQWSTVLVKHTDRITASMVMIVVSVLSVFIPVGPGILYKYDTFSHPVQLLVMLAIVMIPMIIIRKKQVE